MATKKQLAALKKARAALKKSRASRAGRAARASGYKTSKKARLKARVSRKRGYAKSKKIGHGKYAHLTHAQLSNLRKAWAARRGSGKAKKAHGKKRGRRPMYGMALPAGWKHIKGVGSVKVSSGKRGRPRKHEKVGSGKYAHLTYGQLGALRKAWKARRSGK